MALEVREINGRMVEVVPDGPQDWDRNGKIPCWECDLTKECDRQMMFCRDYAYRVHFKLVSNDSK